jgi:PHD/YefM family antitoxin component YafN of YafNO toxin-antitoxin module
LTEQRGKPEAVLVPLHVYEAFKENRHCLIGIMERVAERNADRNPAEIDADIARVIAEVRAERKASGR